jgi:hypothetical protein
MFGNIQVVNATDTRKVSLAKLIPFYTPRRHRKKEKFVPERLRGKILPFPEPKEPKKTLTERFHGILITDKRRFSDDIV